MTATVPLNRAAFRRCEVMPWMGLTAGLVAVQADSDPTGSNLKVPMMTEKLNWHDAHALILIDQALENGGLTDELVEQITAAFQDAESAEGRHRETPV